MRTRQYGVLFGGLVLVAAAQAENLRVRIQTAGEQTQVCAFHRQATGFTKPPLYALAGNNGRADFQNIDAGQYLLVASRPDGSGGVHRAEVSGPGQIVVPMSLNEPGVVCSPGPVISELQAEVTDPGSSRISLAWSSSAFADAAVEYCAIPADAEGLCPACAGANAWRAPGNRGDGLHPLLTGSVEPGSYGKHTVCLQQRFAAQTTPVSNTLQASVIARFGIIDFQVAGGNNRVISPVSLDWTTTFRGNQGVEYRLSENADFDAAAWQPIEPIPGQPGGFHVDEHPLDGQGIRRLRLQMRITGQNGTRTNVVSDNFRLFVAPPGSDSYDLNAGELFTFAQANGWQFDLTPFGSTTGCFPFETDGPNLTMSASGVSGCGYRLFSGRTLNGGWTFEGFTFSTHTAPEDIQPGECLFNVLPLNNEGSSEPTIALHVLALSQPDLPGAFAPPLLCQVVLETVTVSGPSGMQGTDAFVQGN